jgi:hypothetical protein
VSSNPESPTPSSYSSSPSSSSSGSSSASGLLSEDQKQPSLAPPPPATPKRASQAEIWARRIFLVTFVLLCTLLGVFLIVLPWRPEWTENPLLSGYPWLKAVFAQPFFRGICSGFGVLDLWIAISETAHYHEDI